MTVIKRFCYKACIFYSLAYGEWMLERITDKCPDTVEVYVMYDIACTMYKHLKVLQFEV